MLSPIPLTTSKSTVTPPGTAASTTESLLLPPAKMNQAEFTSFLSDVFRNIRHHTIQGAICAAFMDWRHMPEMLVAGQKNFLELKNVCVWVKPNGRLGSFYRSRHELVFLWKCSRGKHGNNFELGQHGSTRTNVWEYAAGRSRGPARKDITPRQSRSA